MRECFSDKIDNGSNFARHAFDEVLSNKEDRLNCPNRTGTIFEQDVMMLETTV